MLKAVRKKIQQARFFLLYRRGIATIEKWQLARLNEVVSHAALHVPMYQALYASSDNAHTQLKTFDDIRRLPITHKDMFLDRPTVETIDNSRPTHSVWKKTSGTAGRPLSVLVSNTLTYPYYSDFACFRFVLGSAFGMRAFDRTRIAHINVRAPQRTNQLFITIADFLSDPDGITKTIYAYKPDIIATYASLLVKLARRVAAHPELLTHKVQYAASFGEMLQPGMRRFIENTLSCEVYDRYGGGEIGAVALECAEHDGMHINSESAFVEILDEEGNAVQDGEYGRVIVTDLLNFNMPFIRYEIGDRGMIVRDRCACGLETPRLWLDGRFSAFLSFGEREIHHLEFDGALDGFMNTIIQYQIVKKTEHDLRIRILPGPLFDAASAERIVKKIREVVDGTVEVSVECVENIPRTPRGKSPIVLDESKSANRIT